MRAFSPEGKDEQVLARAHDCANSASTSTRSSDRMESAPRIRSMASLLIRTDFPIDAGGSYRFPAATKAKTGSIAG
jgi:hypothetical protein